MKDTRPVNLDIGTMRLPVTAWASISHRISGVVLFVASIGMVWALDRSLSSAEGFAQVSALAASVPVKILLWAAGTAMIYHSLAGIRHLLMDFGLGESLRGGIAGARAVFTLAILLSIALGVALW